MGELQSTEKFPSDPRVVSVSDLVACEHVGYRQQGVEILADVDWRIERGEHWAVLGPNGCGKTTLLRIACGYIWPTSGRVLRLGKELLDLGELRRSIGWISSDLAARIPPEDTGLETVVTGRLAQIGIKRLPYYGPTDADFADAVAELAQLGCEALADKPFGVLSQGERQQVLVARARMAGPLLLVLDEPCAGMDPGVRERFLGWLDQRVTADRWMDDPVRRPGLRQTDRIVHPTVILVTHHVEEIVAGIEQTLILRAGRVYRAGPTRDVVTRATIEDVYDTQISRLEESGGRLWPIWGA
jgi:iron complex transport system ATP-binding protein